MKYMMPVQALVKDIYAKDPFNSVFGAILYRDEVICGDTGDVLSLDEVEILEEYKWISISDEIKGS